MSLLYAFKTVRNFQTKKISVIISIAMSSLKTPEVATERATFAMGCFWAPDALFGCTPGVIRTKVGYTGGTSKNPTYRNISDHSETTQIDYDPQQTSYDKLLQIFWNKHDPKAKHKRQYMSAIFYHDENQKQLAMKTKTEYEKDKGKVATQISPAETFYDAEEYHQKFHLKQYPELVAMFDFDSKDMTDSHVCARLNGYVAGFGKLSTFDEEWQSLGLTSEQAKFVREVAASSVGGMCGI